MPELPEVETVKNGMEKAMLGKEIKAITVRRRDLRIPLPNDFETALEGHTVQSLSRRGKYALVFTSNDKCMVIHLGMSGRILIHGTDYTYEPAKHDHIIFTMEDGMNLVFQDPRRFGMVYLFDTNHWQSEGPFAKMGPEPLGNNFHGEILHEKLHTRKTPIKNALLDQHIVAGLGNIYVCEALYEAGIHPERRSDKVTKEECETLARIIRSVLNDAIAAGGSTLRDYKKTDGSLGYFQYSFSVYDQEGNPCPHCTCQEGVKRIVQSGRSTYYCEARQKR